MSTPSFAAALASTKRQVGQRPKLTLMLEQFPPGVRSEVEAAIADTSISHDHLAAAITKLCVDLKIDDKISGAAVRNYRQKL